MLEKVCGTRLQLTALQKTSKIHSKIPGSTVFSQHCWGEEKYDAFCYFQVLALSSHPLLNNKGQIWTPDSYKVYLLRRGKKIKQKTYFFFWSMNNNSKCYKHIFFLFNIWVSLPEALLKASPLYLINVYYISSSVLLYFPLSRLTKFRLLQLPVSSLDFFRTEDDETWQMVPHLHLTRIRHTSRISGFGGNN